LQKWGVRISCSRQAPAKSTRNNHHALSDTSRPSKCGRIPCQYVVLMTLVSMLTPESLVLALALCVPDHRLDIRETNVPARPCKLRRRRSTLKGGECKSAFLCRLAQAKSAQGNCLGHSDLSHLRKLSKIPCLYADL